MGLAEKRQIASLEENGIPEFKERVKKLLGKDIAVNVNWDTFESVAQIQEVHHQCLGRLAEGLERIASDKTGKDALTSDLTTIAINNISDASAKKISYAKGTVTVDGKWEDFSSGIFTPGDYQTSIENSL